ncbi:hypothetical protein FHY30_002710 [Xanthomonas arboricola]|nr:hypothetical protein [Xanthomonas campestris]
MALHAEAFLRARGNCRARSCVSACPFDGALHWLVADDAGARRPGAVLPRKLEAIIPSALRCSSKSHSGPRPHSRGQWRHSHLPRATACAGTASHWARRARHKRGHARRSVVCACVAQLVAEARVIATNSPAIDLSACCGVQNLPTRHGCLAHQQVGKPKRTASRIMALPASRSCNRLRLPAMRKCGQNASFQTLTAPCPKRTGAGFHC